ncbi:protein rep (plasmid) [Clostridium perfringens]|uniref:protein rep n=1 Tax=Clostridium perfringens TaxID=1502 RepID=UPI0024BC31B5|nr:protein rep [Clostridium perfringens]ELC8464112.1 protein rep [Clostridium perfringens]MDT7988931.1 protein rep [Clostridium perfringens]
MLIISFVNRKKVKNVVIGYFRGLEVTNNLDKNSNDYDTYHPHFNIILMVNKSYFII